MLPDADKNIQVAVRAAVQAGLAAAADTHPGIILNSGRYFDFDGFFFADDPGAFALFTGFFNNPPFAAAFGTSRFDNKETALLLADFTAAVAIRANFRLFAVGRSMSVTGFANFGRGNFNLFFYPEKRLFQRDFHIVTQIRPGLRIRTLLASPAARKIYSRKYPRNRRRQN